MKGPIKTLVLAATLAAQTAGASSHMDAPLITLDDAANTTDVYAFVSEDGEGRSYLSTALAVYPFEEPGIGPNNYRFDDAVRYDIHVSLGEDVAAGRPTITYQFRFETTFRDRETIQQAFTDVIEQVGGAGQNLVQEYTVTRVDHRRPRRRQRTVLGSGVTPPNNQGLVTPRYNRDAGAGPALPGVATEEALDPYTRQAIFELKRGHRVFAGQRDDGFYADIQAIFDGLSFRSAEGDSFDSQGGFNVHTIALDIPMEQIGGEEQVVGVFATTSRRAFTLAGSGLAFGRWVQVGRQGNPLFNEGFVAIRDKDLYSRTMPSVDAKLFARYALSPELGRLVNAGAPGTVIAEERTDLAGIFIPDVIKVDLSTGPARLAGGGPVEVDPINPDDPGFHRLGIFGGDVLISGVQGGFGGGVVPGGWPNGRRFGDDVVDIAVSALFSDLREAGVVPIAELPIVVLDGIDNVGANDIAFNKVFPYAATPLNGRNHPHH